MTLLLLSALFQKQYMIRTPTKIISDVLVQQWSERWYA